MDEKNTVNIVIEPCTQCGVDMTVFAARVEDWDTGVIECICPQCGAQVNVTVTIREVEG